MSLTESLQRPMTLVMPLADPSQTGINALGRAMSAVSLSDLLDEGGMVHFARFVIVGDHLLMVSSYDGEFEDYILEFVRTMGPVFDTILGFIADPAPTPTAQHPMEFVAWVHAHDQRSMGFYSGYPGVSTQQVRAAFLRGQAEPPPTPVPDATPADVDWADVQGVIVRGFGMRHVRHLCLHVAEPAGARAFLGRLVDGGGLPQVTDATPRAAKPPLALAVGVTATGLGALGVAASTLAGFETAFVQGASVRARRVGDIGPSAPSTWVGGLGDPDRLHVVLSLYAASQHGLDAGTTALQDALVGALDVVHTFEGACLRAGKDVVHFGYRDNISQPILAGAPGPPVPPDDQPTIPPGELLLGYPSQFPGVTIEVPQPDALGRNGSFAAFRVLRQDTAGFERFLRTAAAANGLDVELLAAKVVGRWRTGEPLVRCPEAPGPLPRHQWNDYGYLADPDGLACPLGAHMRRANPRDLPMHPVGDSSRRRIVRRGMPYGPDADPDDLDDGIERGLLGLFIGASLTLQFETVQGEWLNEGLTDARVTGTNDPLIGTNGTDGGTLTIPQAGGKVVVEGFGEFVTTRAAAYLFLPSITAVRWLAALGGTVTSAENHSGNPADIPPQVGDVAEGVRICGGLGNALSVDLGDSILQLDSGASPRMATAMLADLRTWRPDLRVSHLVYSHGHIGYNVGAPTWLTSANPAGEPPPVVVAQQDVPAYIAAVQRFEGLAHLNLWIEFAIPDSAPPIETVPPTLTFDERLTIRGAAREVQLLAIPSETPDALAVWIPDVGVLHGGAAVTPTLPNSGEPTVVGADLDTWASSLERMDALGASRLVRGFGGTVDGVAAVHDVLSTMAAGLRWVTATVADLMNRGWSEREILTADLHFPEAIFGKDYMHDAHGARTLLLHTAWQSFGGWWDRNPTSLRPAPLSDATAAVLSAVDPDTVLATARALHAAGRAQLALHVVDLVALADPAAHPAVPEAQALKADLCTQRMAECADCWPIQQSFRAAAQVLRGEIDFHTGIV